MNIKNSIDILYKNEEIHYSFSGVLNYYDQQNTENLQEYQFLISSYRLLYICFNSKYNVYISLL